MDQDNKRNKVKDLATNQLGNLAKKQTKKILVRTAIGIAASSSIIWGPILVILLIVFVVILTPFLPSADVSSVNVGSAPISTPEGSPSATLSPSIVPPGNPPTCQTVDQRLKSEFNITMIGTGCENKLLAHSVYASLTVSARFKQLLANVGSLNIIFTSLPQTACHAYAAGNRFVISTKCIQQSTIKRLYIHEMGHKIAGANSSWRYLYPWESLKVQDRNCYDQGFLKTYVFRAGSAKGESFAESMLLYVVGGRTARFLNSQPIYNFKRECPSTYGAIRDNFFGGYEFN